MSRWGRGWWVALWAVGILTSCEVKRPKEVLDDATMEAVLHDYHIAKVMADELTGNETYRRVLYRDGVFCKHGITEAQFDSSMVWFARHPEIIAKLYEKVNKRLKSERDAVNHLIAIRDNQPKSLPSGDSVEVWRGITPLWLTGRPLANRLLLELTTDTTFHLRDSLTWRVHAVYRGKETGDSLSRAVMALSLRFKNDSVVSVWQPMTDTCVHALALAADSAWEIKSVHGSIYMPSQVRQRVLRVDTASLMRYHRTVP